LISGQARNDVHRLPVREREENAVTGHEIFRRLDKTELRQSVQIPMNFADRFAGLLVRRDENDLDVRMKQQNAQQLRAAVTGAAKDPTLILVLFSIFDPRRSSCSSA
jgi:hypothetical protein